jgi:hypothetical protein
MNSSSTSVEFGMVTLARSAPGKVSDKLLSIVPG